MNSLPDPDTSCADEASLTAITLRGSFWLSAQFFLNKTVTTCSTLLIAYLLSPDEYGIAATVIAISAIARITPPFPMGDVLVAYPGHLDLLASTGRRLALIFGTISASATLIAIPVALRVYDTYPAVWLGGLLGALALRPLLDAVLVTPMANLRQRLKFRQIAVTDGLFQLATTLISVGFAAAGGRAASLVLPQLLNEAARAICYTRMGSVRGVRRFRRRVARLLMRVYLPGVAAHYIYSLLMILEISILGYVAGSYQAGLFGFALTLAIQANSVIAARLELVLQPIMVKLQRDATRQVWAFLHTQRMLAAVCIPLALLQAMLAESLFNLLFFFKWQPAVPVFQVLSLMQAFYFASGPVMACLKAQRRFNILLIWQGVQMVLSLPAYWFGAGRGGAVGVAIASVLIWSLSMSIGVWLCTRVEGQGRPSQVIRVFAWPWLIGLPVFGSGYLLVQWFNNWGWTGDVVAIAIVGPMMFIMALLATRLVDSEFRLLADQALQWGWRHIRR